MKDKVEQLNKSLKLMILLNGFEIDQYANEHDAIKEAERRYLDHFLRDIKHHVEQILLSESKIG